MTRDLLEDYIAYQFTTGNGDLRNEDKDNICEQCGQAMELDPDTGEFHCPVCETSL